MASILRLHWCPECHYDLSELPAAHRCPECGAAYEASMFDMEYVRWDPLHFRWPRLARAILYGALTLCALGFLLTWARMGLLGSILRLSGLPVLMGLIVSGLIMWSFFRTEQQTRRLLIDSEGLHVVRIGGKTKASLHSWARFRSVDRRLMVNGCWRLSFRGRRFEVLRVHVRAEEPALREAIRRMETLIQKAQCSDSRSQAQGGSPREAASGVL